MNVQERLYRSRHVAGALVEQPVKGAQVRETHASLEQAIGELTHARLMHERANDDARDSSARVRDATDRAREWCKRGRATLVAGGVAIAPHSVENGSHALPVLARADGLLERAEASKVSLRELKVERDALAQALAARSTAKVAKGVAADAESEARRKWDAAYTALRTAVESELRHESLAGPSLKARLHAYFPQGRGAHRTAAAPQGATAAAPGSDVKPAA